MADSLPIQQFENSISINVPRWGDEGAWSDEGSLQMGWDEARDPADFAWSTCTSAARHAAVIQPHCSCSSTYTPLLALNLKGEIRRMACNSAQQKGGVGLHTKRVTTTSHEDVGIERHEGNAVHSNPCLRATSAFLPLVSCKQAQQHVKNDCSTPNAPAFRVLFQVKSIVPGEAQHNFSPCRRGKI